MRTLTKFAGTCVLAMSVVTTVNAGAFSQLVVFGDSLSDPGNAAAMTTPSGGQPFFPPSPPYAYRFSNGPTAAEYLAQSYGVTVNLGWPTAMTTSNNFAVGGALNSNGNYNFTVDSPTGLTNYPTVANTGIAQQIAQYKENSTPVADQTLFLLWGGPNDIFLGLATRPGDMSNVISGALTAMAYNIQTLVGLGAEHILVPGMPDLGKTPAALEAGPDAPALMSQISAGYNLGLTDLLDTLDNLLADTLLYRFDTAAFLNQVTANPAAYGFTNITEACPTAVWSTDPECTGYLYFDNVHPSTAGHRLLAGQFAAAAPAPETYALMLLGLAVIGWSSSRRRHHYGQMGVSRLTQVPNGT